MFGATGSMFRVVQGDGHSVHGNDFKCLLLKLQVYVAIGRSVHDAPKLAFTRSDFNLRPHGSDSAPQISELSSTLRFKSADLGSLTTERPRTTRTRSGRPTRGGK